MSAKKRSATFLKAPEPKTHPHAIFLQQPKSHTPAREGAWPTFRCRDFFQQARPTPSCTSKPLSILSEPYFSIFLAFQASTGLLSASSSLRRQLPSLVETCVCLGKASSSSPITFLLCLGPAIPGSSSIAVIRPPFRALFDPNMIQS